MIPYELEIGWAHLSSRKGQTAVIVLGIAFAVTAMSFLANLNEGQLRDVLDRAVEDNSPHVVLEPVEDTFPRTRAILAGARPSSSWRTGRSPGAASSTTRRR